MKVSAIVTTYRLGGIDLLFAGLKSQTMTDFELLLVDTLFDHRKDEVEAFAKRLGIDDKVIHLPPPQSARLPQRHFAASLNVGIRKASGELLVFVNDYTCPLPSCFEEHWNTYASSGGRTTTIGSYDYVEGPALKRGYEKQFSEKLRMDDYFSLVENRTKELGISIFDKEFTADSIRVLKVWKSLVGQRYGRELEYHGLEKGDLAPWYEWCYKNDSVPRETALQVGGVDEELGTNDEFAFAYDIVMSGQRLVFNPKNRVLVSRYIDRFPTTIPLHMPLESYRIWAKKREVEWIKLKEGIPPFERVMWYVRSVLLSPKVAKSLRTLRLESFGLGVINLMALGRVDARNNQPITAARSRKTEPSAPHDAA